MKKHRQDIVFDPASIAIEDLNMADESHIAARGEAIKNDPTWIDIPGSNVARFGTSISYRQLEEKFVIEGYGGGLVIVTRKKDGVQGSFAFDFNDKRSYDFVEHKVLWPYAIGRGRAYARGAAQRARKAEERARESVPLDCTQARDRWDRASRLS